MISPALQRASLMAFSALIVVSVAIELAKVTWHLAGDASAEVRMSAPAGIPRAEVQTADIAPILQLAPFGAAAPPPDALPKETTLGLTLRGVVVSVPASASTAVIAGADGVPHVYGVGETLPGSAELVEILPDSVTLRVGGQLETLSFPKKPEVSSGVAAIRASIPASAGGGAPPAPVGPRPMAPKSKDPDAIAEDYRQRIAANPQTVLTDVGLAATSEGYRLEATMMPELKKAGLQPGDVVVRVNGTNVGNVERDRSLFDEIVASGRARVEVMRNGNLIVMSFPLR